MEERMRIEHLVMGSLVNEPGDTTLSFTPGVSSGAEALCRMMAGDGPKHASWYLLHPAAGQHTIVHVQGSHTSFGGGVRDYATRVVYEFDSAALTAAGGYLPLLPSLDAMRRYEEKRYEASPEKMVKANTTGALSTVERQLLNDVAYSLARHRRLFIRVGEDELRVADDLRQSPRLRSLLGVFDHLPQQWRDWISMAFSVNSSSGDAQALLADIHVVVHHDPVEAWGDAARGACVIDWTATQPEWVPQEGDEDLPTDEDLLRLGETEPFTSDPSVSSGSSTAGDAPVEAGRTQKAPVKRKGCVVNILATVLSIVLGYVCCHIL